MKPNPRIIVRLGTLIVTVLAQLSISQNARASCAPNHIIYVSASGSGADGCSWATAYPFLQDAIALSTNGDQIWVATGTYFPDQGAAPIIDNDRNSTFNLKDGVAIYGGFTVGNTLLSQRNLNPATNGTVLSGEIDGIAGNAGNAYHVCHILFQFRP